jgi:hypothetical protein
MTPTDYNRIRRLLNLAEATAEAEFVNAELVSHFHYLREDMGLAKLLLAIQKAVRIHDEKNRPQTTTPTTTQQAQDSDVM